MTEQELRDKNLKTIQDFLDGTLAEGVDISQLFCEDGFEEVPFNPGGEPDFVRGRKALKQLFDENAVLFSDYTYYNTTIYPTLDPDVFWAETYGKGTQLFEGVPKPYENRYFFFFRMRNGLIYEWKEIFDSLKLVRYMGIELPDLPRPHDLLDVAKRQK